MESENPIANPIPEARVDDSVVSPTSAGISNDAALDKSTATPKERENSSKKEKAKLQKGEIGLNAKKETGRKRKAAHPPTSDMALAAIKELKKRNGASLEAIQDYIEEHYVVDMKRMRHHLRKFLMTAVEKGNLEQLGESGAAGRFKIKAEQPAEKGTAIKKKEVADKSAAKKANQVAEKGAAKKANQIAEKGAAKKVNQTAEKRTAMKKKQTTEKRAAKDKETAQKGTKKKEKRQ